MSVSKVVGVVWAGLVAAWVASSYVLLSGESERLGRGEVVPRVDSLTTPAPAAEKGSPRGDDDDADAARTRKWRAKLDRVAPRSANVRIQGRALTRVGQEDLFLRTAVPITPTLLMVPFLSLAMNSFLEAVVECQVVAQRETPPQPGPTTSCRCQFAVASDAEKFGCSLLGGVALEQREGRSTLRLTVLGRTVSSSGSVASFRHSVDVPVEPYVLPDPTEAKHLAICVHGIQWTDQTYGRVPLDLIEAFLWHYGVLGASAVHVYTNEWLTDYADAFANVSHVPAHLKVFVHDTPVPVPNAQNLRPMQLAHQLFATADCLARTVSSGFEWTALLDLDEFVFASGERDDHDPPLGDGVGRGPAVPTLVRQLQMRTQPTVHAVSLQSFMFNTVICAASSVDGSAPPEPGRPDRDLRRLPEYVSFGALDDATHLGRRKNIVRTGSVPPQLVVDGLFSVHEVDEALNAMVLDEAVAHIHHLREAWHPRVCSRVVDVVGVVGVVGEGASFPAVVDDVWRLHRSPSEASFLALVREQSGGHAPHGHDHGHGVERGAQGWW